MISLTHFKSSLLSISRLMIANPGMYIDVIYKGRLYRYTMEDLGIDVKQKRRPRKRSLVDEVDYDHCPYCKKLVINGVCMNSACKSNVITSSKS
jgi:hypothetical protein